VDYLAIQKLIDENSLGAPLRIEPAYFTARAAFLPIGAARRRRAAA